MSEVEHKVCTICDQSKPVDSFSPRTGGSLRSGCKACVAERQRARDRRSATADDDSEGARALEHPIAEYQTMAPFGTPYQRTTVESLVQCGGIVPAAEQLGITPRRFRAYLGELARRAATRGWSPANDMTKTTPEGYNVKGVSTYYGRDKATGEMVAKGQWVKTNRDADTQLEMLLEAVQGIADPFRALADPVPPASSFDDDTITIYPFGDPHIGMYAWGAESGEDFDLEIAERDLVAAVDHLVSLAPSSRQAIVAVLGDTLHADSKRSTTTAGTPVDCDTRWSKVFGVVVRAIRRCIDRALEKHESVKVLILAGNHDEHMSLVLSHCIAGYYEREPRVDVDLSPSKFRWHRFGKCFFGFTHGDTCKKEALPGVMACDRPEDWGVTEYRQWYIGHFHHEQVKEFPGCTVESFRTLAPKDAWHASAGYRSMQDMKLDVWHRDWGRVVRHSVGIAQIRKRTARAK